MLEGSVRKTSSEAAADGKGSLGKGLERSRIVAEMRRTCYAFLAKVFKNSSIFCSRFFKHWSWQWEGIELSLRLFKGK